MSFFPRDLAVPTATPGVTIDWEEANCLLCGGRRWSPLVEAADVAGTGLWFAVVQCHDCGLCFTNPRPSLESIGQFYPSDYAPHQFKERSAKPPRWWRRARRGELPWHGQGRLLDFGCGGGGFLADMHARGWHVTGVDASEAVAEHLYGERGLNVLYGTLPHPELEPESFDVITMWQSLEHVHAPREVLREAERLLAPGGILYVAVPNIDSLSFRWFGRHWLGLDVPRHLTHFTPWTLPLMLERAGFHVRSVQQVRHSRWLQRSAQRAAAVRRGARWRRWLAGGPAARVAAFYGHVTGQADTLLATAGKSL